MKVSVLKALAFGVVALSASCQGVLSNGSRTLRYNLPGSQPGTATEIKRPCIRVGESSLLFRWAPSYEVTLFPDGTALFVGAWNNRHHGKFAKADYRQLSQVLDNQGFWNLNTRYHTPVEYKDGKPVFTIGSLHLSANSGKQTQRVELSGDPNKTFPELRLMLNSATRVVAGIQWDELAPTPNTGIQGVITKKMRSYAEPREVSEAQPVSGAVVSIRLPGLDKEVARTITDEHGKFQIKAPPGVYRVVSTPLHNDNANEAETEHWVNYSEGLSLNFVHVQPRSFAKTAISYTVYQKTAAPTP